MSLNTVNVEGIQRQLVSIIVESSRLKHEMQGMRDAVDPASRLEGLIRTAVRIDTSIRSLYRMLPEELLPTAATLRDIERDEMNRCKPDRESPNKRMHQRVRHPIRAISKARPNQNL